MTRFIWPLLGFACSTAALWINAHASAAAWYCRAGLCRAEDLRSRLTTASPADHEAAYRAMVLQEAANPFRWGELAELESLIGKQPEARRAWLCVSSLGQGSAPVMMQAINAYVTSNDQENTIATAFRVFQLTDSYDEPLFEYLNHFFKLPTGEMLRRALPVRCGTLRSWTQWISTNGDLDDVSRSWHWTLDHGCMDDAVAGRYAWTLVDQKAYQQSAADWAEYMAVIRKQSRVAGQLLWNDTFDGTPLPTPFDWNVDTEPNVDVTRQNGLSVRFAGNDNVDYHHLWQFVSIKPGIYVLEVDAEAVGLTTNEGPQFVVYDASDPKRQWSVSGRMYQGDVPRQIWTTTVRVPAVTRWVAVELVRHPSQKIDSKIRGSLILHSVRLSGRN